MQSVLLGRVPVLMSICGFAALQRVYWRLLSCTANGQRLQTLKPEHYHSMRSVLWNQSRLREDGRLLAECTRDHNDFMQEEVINVAGM